MSFHTLSSYPALFYLTQIAKGVPSATQISNISLFLQPSFHPLREACPGDAEVESGDNAEHGHQIHR